MPMSAMAWDLLMVCGGSVVGLLGLGLGFGIIAGIIREGLPRD